MIRALIIVLFLCLPCFGQTRPVLDTSICSIAAHPSKFHNKNVRIRGTALSGMEASILIDSKDGEWDKQCGRINLDFDSSGTDASTTQFLRLLREQISPPDCNNDKDIMQELAHILDESVPAPAPCVPVVCVSCPRFRIVATFTGRLRYSAREHRQVGFGHLGMFNLQLDVATVSNLEVTDTLAASKR